MFPGLKRVSKLIHDNYIRGYRTQHIHEHPKLEGNARLHVAAVYFNHRHFQNLLTNFQRFVRHMEDLGVTLHVVEVVLNEAEFEVTSAENPHHVQLRAKYELFHKENLTNIAFANAVKLYGEQVKYLAWIDADVMFFNSNVVQDTIDQLQRHHVVQMWANALDMDPRGRPIRFKDTKDSIVESFGFCYQNYGLKSRQRGGYSTLWHPGYAWAIRRDTWERGGGLFDISILGAGDHHMAWAFVGHAHMGIHGGTTDNYKKRALERLYQMKHVVNGDLGYVDGTLLHYWHGRKGSRKYVERWSVLVDNKYEPDSDIYYDEHGLLQLTERNPNLRDGIRSYFAQRNDDANTLD